MHNDPFLPLNAEAVYSWSQGESAWHDLSGADLVDLLESDSRPAFRTILGRLDDLYAGPMYFDIDVNDEDGGIEVAIEQFNVLLDKLQAQGVDLDCVRLFLTGGRGMHIEIPVELFNGKPHEQLPVIYKSMAMELFVDGVDCRVYSGGRGRQWRVPNVRRSNGNYKVPVTADEARGLTVESYRQLCSEPRDFPPLAETRLATGLALLWSKARDRIKARPAKRTFSRAEAELRQRFEVQVGPSIRATLDGEFLPGLGWNLIALQLALMAHALGWDDDHLVAECSGLIDRHESNGRRYGTRFKREAELRRQWHYVENNPAYDFTISGLCAILRPGHKPELAGLEADQPEDAPNYAELIDEAGGDCQAVVEVARQVVGDAALSRTEAASLIKRAAKSANVPVSTLRADLYDPGDTNGLFVSVMRHDFAQSVLSCKAVLPHVPGLRQRAGELVEVRGARIAKVDLAHFGFLVSTVAKWRYPDCIGAPDGMVLQAVLSAGHWPGVPELVGIAHQPTLLGNGTIGAPAGYEPRYKVEDFEPYAGTPAEALQELRALLSEFPFASARDEAAALSAILTAVARPMLRTAPAFLVTAHELGTGKSFLAELIALFAAPDYEALRWAQRAEEQDKLLLSLLVENRPVCCFDNLMRDWQSPTLAAILTTEIYGDRLLGASSSPRVSTKCLWIATGNNIKPGKDLSRRVVTIELDAGMERPLTRRFAADPVATVRADRNRWVMLALRVLQGACAVDLVPLASFGEWTATVRAVLVGAGLPDVLQGVVEACESDDDRITLELLLETWHECFGDEPITLREAIRTVAVPHGRDDTQTALFHLFEEIAMERGEINLRTLGAWCKANAGRVAGGRRLVGGKKGKAGVPWQVLPHTR